MEELITAEMAVAGSRRFGDLAYSQGALYWLEVRPEQKGRGVVMSEVGERSPKERSVRSRLNEYGGGDFLPVGDTLYFTDAESQELIRYEKGKCSVVASGARFGEFVHDAQRGKLYGVMESKENSLIEIDLKSCKRKKIASGADFYSSVTLSPSGDALAWLSWDLPDMPWDETALTLKRFGGGEQRICIKGVSLFQPEFAPDGRLYVIEDRSGFGNVSRVTDDGELEPVCPRKAEFGLPQWVFGMRRYAFLSDGRAAVAFTEGGVDHLGVLDVDRCMLEALDLPYQVITGVRSSGMHIAFKGGRADHPTAIVEYDVEARGLRELRLAKECNLPKEKLSTPLAITFPTERGEAHALYYAPAGGGNAPPAIINCHGGPTAQAMPEFDLRIQYFTSRGYAFVDLNYRGSWGFGRAYREALNGNWGIADVQDATALVHYLASKGLADPKRCAIKGGSAGGYTVLMALVSSKVFSAGTVLFGVASLEALAKHTHKFESRYLDRLVAPYPEGKALYDERTPLNYLDQMEAPLLIFQGAKDAVVPPAQAEMLRDEAERRGVDVSYFLFEGEGHGFRMAETIKMVLKEELRFYKRVLVG